jgi:P-type E1-E2 ATPase
VRTFIISGILEVILGAFGDTETLIEGILILIAISIVVIIVASNDLILDREYRNLRLKSSTEVVRVIRGGQEARIPAEELVVGDIIKLFSGFFIPVDGILVTPQIISIDESHFAGRNILISKEKGGLLISGSTVAEGEGNMLVCAVGKFSTLGKKIEQSISYQKNDTCISRIQNKISSDMTMSGCIIACILVLVLLTLIIVSDAGEWDDESWYACMDVIELGIIIILVAVPGGLPLAVCITLAYNARKMRREGCSVKHLKVCEDMGTITDLVVESPLIINQTVPAKISNYFFCRDLLYHEYDPDERSLIAECISSSTSGNI